VFKILILFIGTNISLFAGESDEFWFCPSAEIALYSEYSLSYGAGFTIAYGKKTSIGFKTAFLFDEAKTLDILEIHLLLRLYLFKGLANKGPFFQLAGGPAIFFPREHDITIPAKIGMFSAGLSFGWRFLLGNAFFIEPQVRGGYPFIAGGSLSVGLRF
jgi:hypothetical protein